MKSKIAIFDLDGTLISRHPWLGILKHHLKERQNLSLVFWYLTTRIFSAPLLYLLSAKKFHENWGEGLAVTIKGMNTDQAKEMFQKMSDEYLLPSIKEKTLKRLRKHQEQGFTVIISSGSFQILVDIIAKRLNVDFAMGTELEVAKGKFSGRVVPPLCFNQGKIEKLNKFFFQKNLDIDFKESFTYSNSVIDMPILNLTGNPVAVDPDRELKKIAKSKNWQII